MNRRQHKRRIYKRIGHQLVYDPFAGFREALLEFYRKLAEALRMLNDNPDKARAIYGTKDTQAQATRALHLHEGAGHEGGSN